jgi:protein gp37
MSPEWVASLKVQCEKARVPFFFKQWGGRQKSKAGRLLEGRTHDEMPALASLYAIQLTSSEFENRAV